MKNFRTLLVLLLVLSLSVAPAVANDISNSTYSETDANITSSPPNGAPPGFAPNQTEAIFRQMMAATKRFWDRINGVVTTTGSAGAYVYTPSNTSYPNTYAQGETLRAVANFTSVGSDTMNINGLGALKLYKPSSSGPVVLAPGDIQSAQMFAFSYDSALNSGGGGFHVQSGLSPASGGVTSIADAINGGLSFSGSTGAVTANLKPSDLATKSSPTTSDSVVIMDAAASNVAKTATIPELQAAFGAVTMVQVQERQNSGTGGATTSGGGSWVTHVINTKTIDTASIAVLSSNTIQLPAGTYDMDVESATNAAGHEEILRLYDVTNSAIKTDVGGNVIVGVGCSCAVSRNSVISLVSRFTLSGSTTLRIEDYSDGTATIGVDLASGQPNVYLSATFKKVS